MLSAFRPASSGKSVKSANVTWISDIDRIVPNEQSVVISTFHANNQKQSSLSIHNKNNNINSDRLTNSWERYDFDLACIIEDYINNGKDRKDRYIDEHLRLCNKHYKANKHTLHRMKEMKAQQNVWKLLQFLGKTKLFRNPASAQYKKDDYYFDPDSFVIHTFNSNTELHKLHMVIAWLEDLAIEPTYLATGDICYSRTRQQKLEHRHCHLRSLDPDVLNRCDIKKDELSKEELLDYNDEQQLLEKVFLLLRKGEWTKAVALCRNYGQHWRAASLNGKQVFCDDEQVDDHAATVGNEHYLMWLRTCKALCENTESMCEKWIYSLLCGNVDGLMSYVSDKANWYDVLWVLTVCKKVYEKYELITNKLPSYYHRDLKLQAINANDTFHSLNIIDPKWKQRLLNFRTIFAYIDSILTAKQKQIEYKYDYNYTNQSNVMKNITNTNANITTTNQNENQNNKTLFGSPISKSLQFKFDATFVVDEDNDNKMKNNNNNNMSESPREKSNKNKKHSLSSFEEITNKYNDQYYRICKYVVCEEYDAMLQDCFVFVDSPYIQNNRISLDFMRFTTHLYLHLKPNIANKQDPNKEFMQFVTKYIRKLAQNKQYSMISRYCCILPETQQIETMTEFLLDLKDCSLRMRIMKNSVRILRDNVLYEVSKNIAESVIQKCVSDNLLHNNWRTITEPQPLNELIDPYAIDSLACLNQINANGDCSETLKTLTRFNQLFTILAQQYKEDGIKKLFEATHLSVDMLLEQANLYRNIQCHLKTYDCWELYHLFVQWHHIWTDGEMNSAAQNAVMYRERVLKMLNYGTYGWLNPKYCAVQGMSPDEINEIRGVIIARVIHRVCDFCEESESHAFLVKVVTIITRELYGYYKLLEKNTLRKLLHCAKNAQIYLIKRKQLAQRAPIGEVRRSQDFKSSFMFEDDDDL